MRAQIALLPDGRRLHLQDGPIDLIIEAFGHRAQIKLAYEVAIARFVQVLDELCSELSLLRAPALPDSPAPSGRVAQRMTSAVAPYASSTFITPMAAVAGAVAEEIVEAMTGSSDLVKAYVNNGGDIALYMAPRQGFVIGMIDRPDQPSLFGKVRLCSEDAVGGIATSGWWGRSFSLGIADSVTVLAGTATAADAAATIIANAVDLPGHPAVHRVPAKSMSPDSDLGELLVTEHVERLPVEDVACALEHGMDTAQRLLSQSLIHAAALHLQGVTRVVGATPGRLAICDREHQEVELA